MYKTSAKPCLQKLHNANYVSRQHLTLTTKWDILIEKLPHNANYVIQNRSFERSFYFKFKAIGASVPTAPAVQVQKSVYRFVLYSHYCALKYPPNEQYPCAVCKKHGQRDDEGCAEILSQPLLLQWHTIFSLSSRYWNDSSDDRCAKQKHSLWI